MGKLRVVTLLMAVAWLVGLAGITAGDSTGTQKRGWWTAEWQPVTQQKAAVKPNPAAVAAKARLDSSSAKRWYVEWNEHTGMPSEVLGRTLKRYSGSPEEAAKEFLKDYRPFFTGLQPERDHGDIQFQVKEVFTDNPNDVGVTFNELYKGIPLYQGGPAVHFDREGHVTGAGGTLYRVDSLNVTPTISPQAAIEALRAATAPDSLTQFGETPLLVWPGVSPVRLAYRINCRVHSGTKTFFYGHALVDAHSGDMLEALSWIVGGSLPARRDSTASTPTNPESGEAARSRRRPAQKAIILERVPEEEWRASKHGAGGTTPDSQLTPYDTTLPRPRPYLLKGRNTEPPRHHAPSSTNNDESSQPSSFGWFYSATFYHDQDFDYDGYDSRAIIEWDADTYSSELLVHVLIYGRDSFGQVVFLGRTPDYTIYDVQPDLYWTDVTVPWRSLWDFRLEMATATTCSCVS